MTTTSTAVVRLRDGMIFDAEVDGGQGADQPLTFDATPEVGGQGAGPSPVQVLLASLGACTGMDVISILRKMRQDVTAYQVAVTGERATEHPRVFTHISIEHVVRGHELAEDSVRRAVELSATVYCPISAMLAKATRVEHRYRIEAA